VAGSIADSTGSYKLALIIFIGAFSAAALAVSRVKLDIYKYQGILSDESIAGGFRVSRNLQE
jgi:hypothetical protein